MKSGTELALAAMKKELARLSRAADKAKAEADEAVNISSEFIAIHKETAEVIKSGDYGKATLKRLDDLKKRQDRANRILKKDTLKLLDKEHEAQRQRDALAEEIHMLEWRLELRKNQGGVSC